MSKTTDHLFTARWAIKNGKEQLAYEEVTSALTELGAIAKTVEEEPDRPSEPPIDKSFDQPVFEAVKGVKFKEHGKFNTPSGKFKGLVVHYTASGRTRANAIGVVKYLAGKGLGCMVMDEDGIIYHPEDFNVLTDVAYHAGKSSWMGKSGMSSYMAGMEICCWGLNSKVGPFRESSGEANIKKGKYQTYTEAQEKALIGFCRWAKEVNPEFDFDWVAGHDEIAPTRKQDPGASLSMTMPELRKLLKGA